MFGHLVSLDVTCHETDASELQSAKTPITHRHCPLCPWGRLAKLHSNIHQLNHLLANVVIRHARTPHDISCVLLNATSSETAAFECRYLTTMLYDLAGECVDKKAWQTPVLKS